MSTIQEPIQEQVNIREPNLSEMVPASPAEASFSNADLSFSHQALLPRRLNYRWWLSVSLFTICLLIAQSGATLLGKFYYNNGGNSKWLASFVQSAGFPIVIPFLLYFSPTSDPSDNGKTVAISAPLLMLIFIAVGVVVSFDNLMYSFGQKYLPVSTYSLLSASQLAFNALFSYFLNSLKFTPFIINSVVLLTTSATIIALHSESAGPTHVSTEHYIIGLLCTIGASALYSLVLSLAQVFFEKIVKRNTVWVILQMQIYPSLLATCICVVGIFASGEWRTLKGEMHMFKSGKVSYVMTVVWSSLLWQLYSLSTLGLIYVASSLVSNIISTVGLPIIPILAVIFFHDDMNGMKIIALILAVWGFVSYFYQHYLDESKPQHCTTTNVNNSSDV